jgi:hypothetical protein
MRSQKSDKEDSPSKSSAFQSPKAKVVARSQKPKVGNKAKSPSLGQPVARKNGVGTMRSETEHTPCHSEEELQVRIAKRAYELYEQRGWQHGDDQADWFQAAHEVLMSNDVEVRGVA